MLIILPAVVSAIAATLH